MSLRKEFHLSIKKTALVVKSRGISVRQVDHLVILAQGSTSCPQPQAVNTKAVIKNKKTKVQPQTLYSIEDLQGNKGSQDLEISKKLDMDKAEHEKALFTHQDTDPEPDVYHYVGHHVDDQDIITSEEMHKKIAHSLKGSFKSAQNPNESRDGSLRGGLNTPGFNTNDIGASKLSTIEKLDDSKKYNDNEIEEIVHNISGKKQKPIPKSKLKKGTEKSSKQFSNEKSKKPRFEEEKKAVPMKHSQSHKDRSIEKPREESPFKNESSKGHHEIVSILNNPNALFNDASSIKYSVDNQNMSNFSIPSITGDMNRASLDALDGMCLDLISAFVGDRFPTFIFVNKKVCSTFLEFQLEINDEVLNALSERVHQSASYSLHSISQTDQSPKETLQKLKSKSSIFSLTDSCHEKFLESIQTDIPQLMEILSNYALKKKDIVIMKLYFTFMGRKYSGRHDNLFMRQTHRFLYDNRHEVEDALDPILHFKFTGDVITQVKSLLGEFLNQSFIDAEMSDLGLLDAFTTIIIEALQY